MVDFDLFLVGEVVALHLFKTLAEGHIGFFLLPERAFELLDAQQALLDD